MGVIVRQHVSVSGFPVTGILGGIWQSPDPTMTNVIIENIGGTNVAHGTQAGGPFSPFDDSYAFLLGHSENHSIELVVWLSGSIGESGNKEIEAWLRCQYSPPAHSTAFGDTSTLGYEINVHYQGAYGQVGVFKGALLQSFSTLPTPATGDRFRAQIVQEGANARIQAWWNNVQVLNYVDTAPVRGGNPAIGFFAHAGAANDKFGITHVLASDVL